MSNNKSSSDVPLIPNTKSEAPGQIAIEMPPKKYPYCKHCGGETPPPRWDSRPERQSWKHTSECIACRNFKTKHGFTLTKEDRDYLNSRPYCGYCGTTERLHIDHCHETNKVRGYLCMDHNMALGVLGDNLAGLYRMISYLQNAPK